jgi:hypothetical protein
MSKNDGRPPKGAKVVLDGAVKGTFIGVTESGKWIIDLGHGTTLADRERVVPLA